MCEQVGQAGHREPEYFEEAEGESRNFHEAWRRIRTDLSAVCVLIPTPVDQETRTAVSIASSPGSEERAWGRS